MAAGDYTIALTVGSWSVTMDRGDLVDPLADAVAIDPLDASWKMTGRSYPSQPEPMQLSFGLYVPAWDPTMPTPLEGDPVEVTITTPDTAGAPFVPVLDFVGAVTDCDATRLRDGVRFAIVAVELRAQLGDERLGDEPWVAESRRARLERLVLLSGQPLAIPAREELMATVAGLGPDVAARDVDSQTTAALLDELLGAGVTWSSLSPAFWITGYVDGTFRSPKLTTWLRPIVSQSVDALGEVTYPIVYVPGGGPDLDAALPYTVALVAGVLTMQRKPIAPEDNQVAWIPAAAVQLDSVTWRQDKATNTNRARVTAPDIVTIALVHTGSVTAEFADLVAAKGPNEIVVQLDAAQTDYVAVTDLLYALLGRYYDAVPRWTLDTFTILPEQIAAGDQWPRLFNPREHVEDFDQAAGRFILLTDLDPRWNLSIPNTGAGADRPPDFWGRLAGATLRLDKGKLRMTATLAHRLPFGMGKSLDYPDVVPTHHPITYAELDAIAQAAQLVPNAHFPANVAGYTGSNAALTWTGADGGDAAGAMVMTAAAGGNAIAVDSGSGVGGIPVVAGRDYQVQARPKAMTTGRVVQLKVDWWNGAGVFLSTSTYTSADATGAYGQLDTSFRAPAGAAFARRQFLVAGVVAGEVHRLDDFTFNLAHSYHQAGDLTPADMQLVEG